MFLDRKFATKAIESIQKALDHSAGLSSILKAKS